MMPSQSTNLRGIFRRAAEVIDTNGHHKGMFVAPAGIPDRRGEYHPHDETKRPVDVVGAIRIACWQLPTTSCPAAEAAIQFASLHMRTEAPLTDGLPDYVEHLCFWNDLGISSEHEVVGRLLRWAIDANVEAGQGGCRVTAPTIAPVSAGAMWAFARTPEPAVCRSNHPHAQSPLGHVACAADHEALDTDVHGADVGGNWFTWTDQAAATAWANVRRCLNTYCGAPVPEGVTYCRNACRLADKYCASDHDDVECEAA